MKKLILAFAPAVLLTACNTLQWNSDILGGPRPDAAQGSGQTAPADSGAPLSAISTEDALASGDLTDSLVAVPSTDPADAYQGRASTVASLGDPAIPGMWMQTDLVTRPQAARLRSANGKEVMVTLKPAAAGSSGGGRLSIGAMRALGAPLSELVEVQVLPAG
jgi:hypothetical protein